jgi:hypothetical protein
MELVYPYAQIIHLILAIMFLGYVFTDVVVLSALKSKFDSQTLDKIYNSLGKRSFSIFPLTLVFLILTGGMMMSKYINTKLGAWDTFLQQALMFKIVLALIIFIGVSYSVYKKLTKGKKSHFMQHHFHKLVLLLGLFIVLAAKVMFWV